LTEEAVLLGNLIVGGYNVCEKRNHAGRGDF
jgi:hypothetical protein